MGGGVYRSNCPCHGAAGSKAAEGTTSSRTEDLADPVLVDTLTPFGDQAHKGDSAWSSCDASARPLITPAVLTVTTSPRTCCASMLLSQRS